MDACGKKEKTMADKKQTKYGIRNTKYGNSILFTIQALIYDIRFIHRLI